MEVCDFDRRSMKSGLRLSISEEHCIVLSLYFPIRRRRTATAMRVICGCCRWRTPSRNVNDVGSLFEDVRGDSGSEKDEMWREPIGVA